MYQLFPPKNSSFEKHFSARSILDSKCSLIVHVAFQVDELTLTSNQQSLGLRIESRAAELDSSSGQPQCMHHHISHVTPGSPLSQHLVVQPGDELLELNGRVLVGLTHAEAAGIVRDTPTFSSGGVKVVVGRQEGVEGGGGVVDDEEEEGGAAVASISIGELFVAVVVCSTLT